MFETLKKCIVDKQNDEIFKEVTKTNKLTLVSSNGENLLHFAAAYNNVDICKYFLENLEVHVNIENFRGATPLYYAALSGSTDTVKILVKHGANPRIRSGFSNLFPINATKLPEIQEILEDADNRLVPITGWNTGFLFKKPSSSYYDAYRYRYYMWWRANFCQLFSGGRSAGSAVIPEAEEIFKQSGLLGLEAKCNDLYRDYLNRLNSTEKNCLVCNKSENLETCEKCNSVRFCSSICRQAADRVHKVDCQP
jgi:hypothetical protein